MYVPYPVTRPVQHEPKGHDANGHVLASNFVEGNQARLHLQEGQTGFFRDGSNKGMKGKKHPCTKSTVWVPKKVHFEKHCNLCKRHGGAYTMHNTCDCCRFSKDRKEKSNFRAAKKGGKKVNPVNHNIAQLTKKIEKLKNALKKSGKKA